MGKDVIDEAIDLAINGQAKEGIKKLWAKVRNKETRSEALFALAYCFEQDGNLMTACYLYQVTIDAHPGFDLAARRLQDCEELAAHKGFIEDFDDMGHQSCAGCDLRFRAEYTVCPYCGTMVDSGEVYSEGPAKKKSAPVEEEDPTFADHVVDIGKDAVDYVQGVIESDGVKDFGSKVQDKSKSAINKAKDWGKSEQGEKVGQKTDDALDKMFSNKPLRNLADSIESIHMKAADKIKELGDSDKTKETTDKAKSVGKEAKEKFTEFMQSESVQDAKKQAKKAGKKLLDKLKGLDKPHSWDKVDDDEHKDL
jgi:hypothetical protein